MEKHVFRLKYGDDLKLSIEEYCIKNNITAGVVLSSVGCLTQAQIRNAGGDKTESISEKLEIISLNGTISKNGCHLHISVSDKNLKMYGGHLKEGCIINTTAEMVLLSFNDIEFVREYDSKTGYKELIIKQIGENYGKRKI